MQNLVSLQGLKTNKHKSHFRVLLIPKDEQALRQICSLSLQKTNCFSLYNPHLK